MTGAAADHRYRIKSSEVAAYASALLGAIQSQSNPLEDCRPRECGQGIDRNREGFACESRQVRSRAGTRQPAAVHQIVHQINQALGNVGPVITYLKPLSEQTRPAVEALRELAGEMANGQVNTLVMAGWNPVFTAPAELEFEANLKKVANTIYLAQDPDETAAASKWVIPAAHFLESWGDAATPDGTASIQQPTIQPIHDGKTPAELVALIAGYKDQKAYDIVRNYWLPTLSGGEKAWRKALHDGLLPAAANSGTTTPAFFTNVPGPSSGGGYEVVFVPSWSVFDGRFANNAWLQEAPDPITKLTWDNAALLSPATAKKLGVSSAT